MSRRGPRNQPEPEVRNSANPRANFASIKAFCQIARRAFSEEEVHTIASMLADTRGPAGQPQYDERDVRNSRNQPREERGSRNQPREERGPRNQPERAERGGRSGGRNANEGGRGAVRAERGGRSSANEGGRGSGRAERGGRSDEGGRPRRNNRRPTQ